VLTDHAEIRGLRPGTSYSYAVTAANDAAATPLRASVRTAPAGRVPFRFTSFGDLATPNTNWVLSYGQSAYAVQAVESFQPLFHLLNGDLCYADLNPTGQPEVWNFHPFPAPFGPARLIPAPRLTHGAGPIGSDRTQRDSNEETGRRDCSRGHQWVRAHRA
jgi:hypothetical protein